MSTTVTTTAAVPPREIAVGFSPIRKSSRMTHDNATASKNTQSMRRGK